MAAPLVGVASTARTALEIVFWRTRFILLLSIEGSGSSGDEQTATRAHIEPASSEDGLAELLALLAGGLDAFELLGGAVEVEDVADEVGEVGSVVVRPRAVGALDLRVLHVDEALIEGRDQPPAHRRRDAPRRASRYLLGHAGVSGRARPDDG